MYVCILHIPCVIYNGRRKIMYIIFGAGKYGVECFGHMNPNDVAFFCDNNKNKVGTYCCGKLVISFYNMLEIVKSHTLIIAVMDNLNLRQQLNNHGIYNYIIYANDNEKRKWLFRNDSQESTMDNDEDIDSILNDSLDKCDILLPLEDFYAFREIVSACKHKLNGRIGRYNQLCEESMRYGHAKTIMDYAGIKTDYANFPIVQHGFRYTYPLKYYTSACVFMDERDRFLHNQRNPYIPAFAFGAYIRYAKNLLTEQQMLEKKNKLGKSVLIFLTHSIEQQEVGYDQNYVFDEITKKYMRLYDTVMVCAYWNDVEQPIYQKLSDAGVRVVSAGLRWDENFICRLRTIMELCDKVIIYGFTSAVLHSLAMNKPTMIINVDKHIIFAANDYALSHNKKFETDEGFYKLLYQKYGSPPHEISSEQQIQLDNFFGLNIHKSKHEIIKIYEMCCDIWDSCNHILKDYVSGVCSTYNKYQCEYNFEKLNLLSNAIRADVFHR